MILRSKSSLFLCLFLFLGTEAFSSFVWDQRADFGGGVRDFAIGMSIGSKGYAGTGRNPTGSSDFWEYDPVTNAWTQKAPYPGSGRYGMIAFSISHRGYVGLGWSGSGGGAAQYKDFWEYDPTANTWTRKTDFGGNARYSAVAFVIDTKGYVGTGYTPLTNDFWAYDQPTNTWSQKANVPGPMRQAATGFAIGQKGYVGTGYNNGAHFKDFYEYDPVSNSWSTKPSVPGMTRRGAVSFSIGNFGYVGMGYNDTTYLTDFYQYDQIAGTWSTVASIGGIPRYGSFAFAIGNEGYVGTGSFFGVNNPIRTSDFWRFSVCSDSLSSGIEQIYPSPSIYLSVSSQQSSIILRYDLKDQQDVQFTLYDVLGREMISAQLNQGSNYLVLPAALSKGVYLYSAKNNRQILGSGKVEMN
jgi:N-acetylneuraminic acid mutarotase